jgi:hypothetical protein
MSLPLLPRQSADWQLEASANADQGLACAAPTSVGDTRDLDEPEATVQANDADASEPAELRALRSRVSILEVTLEDQDAALARTQAQLAESIRRESDLTRVRLTLQALRERLNGNPQSQSLLDRVEAAVSRLAPSPGLQRPTLPTAPQPTPAADREPSECSPLRAHLPAAPAPGVEAALVTLSPIAAPDTAQAPQPEAVVPEVVADAPPVPASTTAAESPPVTPDPTEAVAPPSLPPASDARVLPVPALPIQPVPRARRWRRGGAA